MKYFIVFFVAFILPKIAIADDKVSDGYLIFYITVKIHFLATNTQKQPISRLSDFARLVSR